MSVTNFRSVKRNLTENKISNSISKVLCGKNIAFYCDCQDEMRTIFSKIVLICNGLGIKDAVANHSLTYIVFNGGGQIFVIAKKDELNVFLNRIKGEVIYV